MYMTPVRTEPVKGTWFYVGIDQSYSGTGLVIAETNALGGIAKTKAYEFKAGTSKMQFPKRMTILVSQMDEALSEIDRDRATVIMEGAAYAAEFNTFMLGQLAGVILYYLDNAGFKDVHLIQPTTLKKFFSGSGRATKADMAEAGKQLWGFTNKSDNIVDAYALAMCGVKGVHLAPVVPKKKKKKSSLIPIEEEVLIGSTKERLMEIGSTSRKRNTKGSARVSRDDCSDYEIF